MTAPDSCGCVACAILPTDLVMFVGTVPHGQRTMFRTELARMLGMSRSRVRLWQCEDSEAETQTRMFALHVNHRVVMWHDLERVPHNDVVDRFHKRTDR